MWGLLGWQDIRQRYRRSVIGPFWLTISTAVMVGSMGLLYARILNQSVAQYIPYLTIGLILWGTISTIVNEACTVFVSNEHIIKQVRLPLTTHVCRLIWRNALMFAHNAIILVVVVGWFNDVSWTAIVVACLGVLILFLNGLWVTLVLGVMCTRYRDIPPIVVSVMQIAFFLTPILWQPEVLGEKMWIATLNPLYHQVEAVRAPLMVGAIPWTSVVATIGVAGAGFIVATAMLSRYRSRVPYWL